MSFFIELRNISKTFPGVRALHNVSFDLQQGEVHALVGENGAGKSTLIKILSGVYSPDDAGGIIIDGEQHDLRNPHEAQLVGIATIYQELLLLPELTVAENIFLGHAPKPVGASLIGHQCIQNQGKFCNQLMLATSMSGLW